jgi:hypothetical protein
MPIVDRFVVTDFIFAANINIVDRQEFERVRKFKYLGSSLTEDNDVTIEIEQILVMTNRASYGLKKQLN